MFQNNQNGNSQIMTMGGIDPAIIAAAETAKARVQAAFQMALYKPRQADQARVNILNACKDPMFAAEVEFSKPVAGGKIKGLSIRFAEMALDEWGNVDIDISVVHEDDRSRRTKVVVTDLEKNTTYSRTIQTKKTVERKNKIGREVVAERKNSNNQTVYVVVATEDELMTKENALISKAIRNEGLRLIPADIKNEALRVAAKARNAGIDPNAEKKKLIDAFAGMGVKPVDITQYLGHKLDTLSIGEIDDLRLVYKAIKDGEAIWSSYVEESEPKVDLKAKISGMKKNAPKAELKAEDVVIKSSVKSDPTPPSIKQTKEVAQPTPTDDQPMDDIPPAPKKESIESLTAIIEKEDIKLISTAKRKCGIMSKTEPGALSLPKKIDKLNEIIDVIDDIKSTSGF